MSISIRRNRSHPDAEQRCYDAIALSTSLSRYENKKQGMKIFSKMSNGIPTLLVALFTFMSVQAPVMAAMVTTEQLAYEQHTETQRDALRDFFSRDDVVAQLAE